MLWILLSCTGGASPTDGAPSDSAAPDSAPPDEPCDGEPWRTPAEPAADTPALQFDGEGPTNLLLISIDTLRRDALGRYGGADTPALDGLLAGGVALDDHRSCANWTLDAMTCVLSGRYAWDLGYAPSAGTALNEGRDLGGLPEGVELLADRLRAAGFDTALATGNPYLNDSYNMTGGYDQVVGYSVSAEELWAELAGLAEGFDGGPWFLHLHVMEPHAPYAPPDTYLDGLEGLAPIDWDLSSWGGVGELDEALATLDPETLALALAHLEVRYAGEVAWLDDQIAAILADLDARGMAEGTLIALVSDHGEQLYDHNLFRHGEQLYGEETMALAGFYGAGLRPGPWGGPTTHADLAPTLLEAFGLEVPADWTGLIAGTAGDDRPRFSECVKYGSTHVAADLGGQRLIFNWEGGTLERYALATDPEERSNLHAPGDPESAAIWEAHLGPLVERVECVIEVDYPARAPDL